MVGSEQIRSEDRLPLVIIDIGQQAQRRRTGGVHDQVDLPQLTSSFATEPLTVVRTSNVGDDRDAAGELSQSISPTSADDDGCAEVRRTLGDGSPDP
jgi:hypothetical protein